MAGAKIADDIRLNGVGVLILINHYVSISIGERPPDIIVFSQQEPEKEDEVIIIHKVISIFVFPVKLEQVLKLGHDREELRILRLHDLCYGTLGVCRFT